MSHNTFTHALARYPTTNLCDGLTSQALGVPDFELAMQQYSAYLDALRGCGIEVTVLPGDATYPDGCFVEDLAVIYKELTVITQPGAASRQGEANTMIEALKDRNPVCMTGEARLDGGDVLFCADRVLIGISERTNREGAEQLRNALTSYDAGLQVEFVPFGGVLHLKSGVTELAPGVLLRSPVMTCDFGFDFAETHLLPVSEAHGANVLPINNSVFIMQGYPTVRRLAEGYYNHIVELAMTEFEKMDGSLTCLSLRYQKQI